MRFVIPVLEFMNEGTTNDNSRKRGNGIPPEQHTQAPVDRQDCISFFYRH